MALCAAHREEGAALQLERLSAHQVNDVWADFMHLPAVPLLHRIFVQRIEVFMSAVQEQDSEREDSTEGFFQMCGEWQSFRICWNL